MERKGYLRYLAFAPLKALPMSSSAKKKPGRPAKPASEKTGNFSVRMSPDLRGKLEAAATASGRSVNAEITFRLEKSFDLPSTLPADLQRRIASAAEKSGRSFEAELAFWLESYAGIRYGLTDDELLLMRYVENRARHSDKDRPEGTGE